MAVVVNMECAEGDGLQDGDCGCCWELVRDATGGGAAESRALASPDMAAACLAALSAVDLREFLGEWECVWLGLRRPAFSCTCTSELGEAEAAAWLLEATLLDDLVDCAEWLAPDETFWDVDCEEEDDDDDELPFVERPWGAVTFGALELTPWLPARTW